MAHYAMLRDYHFAADRDDVRGANVYGPNNEKLGRVDEVVFNHENGEVSYLVVETVHARKHLLPADRVYRPLLDEKDFVVNLTRAELESLPDFDDKTLESEEKLSECEKRHAEACKQFEKAQEERYRQGWHAEPVQHRRGSSRNITPEPDEMPPVPDKQEMAISSADLFPQRLAGKFPDPAPNPAKITETIAGTPLRAAEAAHEAIPLSPRWDRFRDLLRSEISDIRRQCPSCSGRRAA